LADRTTDPEPASAPSATPLTGATGLLIVVGVAAILAGQILLQTYPAGPAHEFLLPTLGGLFVLGMAFSESLLSRLPPRASARVAPFSRHLDPHRSVVPLYLTALLAAATGALIAGGDLLARLPLLAVGFWLCGMILVLIAASALGPPAARLPRWEFIGLLILVALAAVVRFVRLGEIPWLLAGDEASVGLSAREFLDGVWNNPFRVAWYSFPSLFFLLPAASIAALGQTIEGLRFPAAIAGTLTVLALFFYARSTFGRMMAFLSAGYLAFFHFHVHFSRIALNNIWDALALTVFAYLLWRAWSEERTSLFAWAGIVAGLAQYLYTSTRILIVLLPIWILLGWLLEREKARRIGRKWLVLLAAAAVAVLPLAFFFAAHPAEFTAPMVRVSLLGQWLTDETAITGLPAWRILVGRIVDSGLAFTVRDLRHWYAIDHPMLLPVPATLFLIGFMMSLLRARDLRFAWLLLWVGAGIVAGGLSESTPAAQRYVFVAPAVAVLVALPLAELGRLFAHTSHRTRTLAVAAGAAVLLVAAALDLRFYFQDYTPSRRFSDRNTEVAQDLARFLRAEELDQGAMVFFSGMPRMGWDSIETLPYLVPDGSFTDITEPLTAPPSWPIQRPAVFVFLPENLGDLPWVERAHPGGETVVRVAADEGDLYTAYLLR
jgi:4-amino-4-deoxy-L-arabinose transferase-like glycosyltransferase